MASIKSIEGIAEAGVAAGSKLLPSKFTEIAESLASKAGLATGKSSTENLGRVGAGTDLRSAGKDALSPLQIVDTTSGTMFTPGQKAIADANEALLDHVTQQLPQVQAGKLDWIIGGSAATNALASARSISILDAGRLPAIVPSRTIEIGSEAAASYRDFLRKVGDIDAFVVKNGENNFLKSNTLDSMERGLPAAATGALTAVGEARTSRLMQAVKMEFDHPEVAAFEYAGKTVYVTGPGQLMGNKMRQVLLSYAPADAGKMTGDFSYLLDAASRIYTEKELLKFGTQALERNSLLYKREVTVPWDRSENNAYFLDFLRKVLESGERNGAYLKKMEINPVDSITAVRLLEKHPIASDKSALTDFINRHSSRLKSMDHPGTPERLAFTAQGGVGKAAQKFYGFLDTLPARQSENGLALSARLKQFETSLGQDFNLPKLLRQRREGL